MSDSQLYLAIGVPVVINILFNGILFGILFQVIDRRLNRIEDKLEFLTGKVLELGIQPRCRNGEVARTKTLKFRYTISEEGSEKT